MWINRKTNQISNVLLTGFLVSLLCIFQVACHETKFRGGTQKPKLMPERCEAKTRLIGVDIAFLVDNSSSTATTDCPQAQQIGRHSSGQPLYECRQSTQREQAILETFDALAELRNDQEESISQATVISFPSADNVEDGAALQTASWLTVIPEDRTKLAEALAFTRKPLGMTPYGAGLAIATEEFNKLPESEKTKIAILVTDGEPTDKQPESVIELAQKELKDKGVKIYTILVNDLKQLELRQQAHREFLSHRGYDQSTIDQLIGTENNPGLTLKISEKRYIISEFGELKNTLQDIIKKNIQCPN